MQLSHSQQTVVARFLTGSNMEPKQKEYVCEGPVVKVHDAPSANVLPRTEYVRQDFPMIMQFLETHDPCHLHLPIVNQDDLITSTPGSFIKTGNRKLMSK